VRTTSSTRRRPRCPHGHPMRARIVKELSVLPRFKHCHRRCAGAECGLELSDELGYYKCKECKEDGYFLCLKCARDNLGLPQHRHGAERPRVVDTSVGDIFLAGPDWMGIHHVILARGPLRPADPDIAEHFQLPPGAELLCCQTMESTRASIGEETWWYPTLTIFQRDPSAGTFSLVADHPPGSNCIEKLEEPVPVKVLLHPLRDGSERSRGFDAEKFDGVIEDLAEKSRRYGKRTAVKSFLHTRAHRGKIAASDYSSAEVLMDKLHKSWDTKPICASVAIKCWQSYLEEVSHTPAESAERILDVMPHWCDKTMPSLMVKTLSQRGWILLENVEG